MDDSKNHKTILKDRFKTTFSEIKMIKPILDEEGIIKNWKPVKNKSELKDY